MGSDGGTKKGSPSAPELQEHLKRIQRVPQSWLDPATRPAPREYLLTYGSDGVILQGKVGLLGAQGGTGKTQAMVQLGVAKAVGGVWLGQFSTVSPGGVLLLLAEEDLTDTEIRVWATVEKLGLLDGLHQRELDLLSKNLYIAPLAGLDVACITNESGGLSKWAGVLRDHIRALGRLRLIGMDPGSRWGGVDVEKDNFTATKFIEYCESLALLPGSPTVLVTTHISKASATRETPLTDRTPRGASALFDGARWVAMMGPDGKAPCRLLVTKSNYTAKPPPLDIHRDDDGFLTATVAQATGWAHGQTKKPLSNMIYEYLVEEGPRTAGALRVPMKANRDRIKDALDELIQSGAVEKYTGQGGWDHYRPKSVAREEPDHDDD